MRIKAEQDALKEHARVAKGNYEFANAKRQKNMYDNIMSESGASAMLNATELNDPSFINIPSGCNPS